MVQDYTKTLTGIPPAPEKKSGVKKLLIYLRQDRENEHGGKRAIK
jgi:hypothetical protein